MLVAVSAARAEGVLTEHDLSFDLAHGIALQALETCRTNGNSVTVTVLGRAANVLVVLSDDKAAPHTIENSHRKAYTARTFKAPSAEFAARYAANPAAVQQVVLANIAAAAGAFPIKVGNEVIGSIGVSGSPGGDQRRSLREGRYRQVRGPVEVAGLLDLGFLERDVLANDRVVFAHFHFGGLGARILFRHVEEPGIGSRYEFDLDGIGLSHSLNSWWRGT